MQSLGFSRQSFAPYLSFSFSIWFVEFTLQIFKFFFLATINPLRNAGRQCETIVRKRIKSLTPEKRLELEEQIIGEMKQRGFTGQAISAGMGMVVGAVVTEVIRLKYFLNQCFVLCAIFTSIQPFFLLLFFSI
jgi:hypothetical protein